VLPRVERMGPPSELKPILPGWESGARASACGPEVIWKLDTFNVSDP